MADLLSKIGAMYQLMNDGGELAKLITMQDILAQMSEQMLECARFIKDYTETRSFCKQLASSIYVLPLLTRIDRGTNWKECAQGDDDSYFEVHRLPRQTHEKVSQ